MMHYAFKKPVKPSSSPSAEPFKGLKDPHLHQKKKGKAKPKSNLKEPTFH
jgi:hypothetical protein